MTGTRTVVLTGAAGGVGKAVTERLVALGARVIAFDRDAEALAVLAKEYAVEPVAGDVSNPDDVRRAVDQAGQVDVLINNAGAIDRLGRAHEAELHEWRRLLDINLTGPYLFCHDVIPGMLERGGGVIVNVASVTGLRGGRAGAAYTASKHGLVGLSLNIAATLGHEGIRCNVVCPGSIDTAMQTVPADAFPAALEALQRDRRKPAPVAPEKIAEAILFLTTDAASAINGVALPVDQGFLAY